MLGKKSPRLAAAFVVTVSAGCGGASAQNAKDSDHDGVSRTNAVMSQFINRGDGNCYIEIFANPPFQTPVDCETKQPRKTVEQNAPPQVAEPDKPPRVTEPDKPKPPDPLPPPATTGTASTLTPRPPDETNLPDAPKGRRVEKNPDGSCTAYSTPPVCRPQMRCNPPPPMKVKCPSGMAKEASDPAKI